VPRIRPVPCSIGAWCSGVCWRAFREVTSLTPTTRVASQTIARRPAQNFLHPSTRLTDLLTPASSLAASRTADGAYCIFGSFTAHAIETISLTCLAALRLRSSVIGNMPRLYRRAFCRHQILNAASSIKSTPRAGNLASTSKAPYHFRRPVNELLYPRDEGRCNPQPCQCAN
jgi:hypothetical protein